MKSQSYLPYLMMIALEPSLIFSLGIHINRYRKAKKRLRFWENVAENKYTSEVNEPYLCLSDLLQEKRDLERQVRVKKIQMDELIEQIDKYGASL